MLRHSWILLVAAVTFASACGPQNPTVDAGPETPDSGPVEHLDAGTGVSCSDGVKNGDETAVDCGGSCSTKCALGIACSAGTDCASGQCANGVCVECNDASQCPGTDTACSVRACVDHFCSVTHVAAGTHTSEQTPNDCKVSQCDGAGNIVAIADDTDLPADDGNACTTEVCTNGVASHPNAPADTACTTGGGSFCDGKGACVACNTAAQCPGQDTECQARTCTAGVCGVTFTAAGTPVSAQTAGDCKADECDGAGNVTQATDDTDVPADDGNGCTLEACHSGVAAHDPAPVDTACNSNGGSVCDASGACVACNTAAQCPGQDTECQTRTCTAGACGFTFTAQGTQVSSQTTGDCKVNQCNGSGGIVAAADNNDLPADDGNQCTTQACVNGTPAFPTAAADSPCSQNGGSVCSPAGTCVACNTATQCPGQDTDCSFRTCTNHVCGTANVNAGVATKTQTAGDCQKNQCNGSGGVVAVADNSDVPGDDGNQCTSETCTSGVPSHPPTATGTSCNQNGGTTCNGAGACVGCTTASQCPGQDTQCQTRTCTSGTCGFNFTAAGTATSPQTAGDCQKSQCDGSGNVVTVADNADLPADDGNQCTSETCTNGTPAHPAKPVDTACTQNGGTVCSTSATCVQCNTATQCAGTDTDCKFRSCTSNVCGTTFVNAGVATSSQVAGDCKENQCDGAGNVVAANKNTDTPVDNNQCTSDVCTNGVPSNPPTAAGTTCSQNGGAVCDSTASCVQCNAAADCPGTDTQCHTRTCSANTCGANNAPAGTVLTSQTPGDCQQAQCDGSGGSANVPDNTDVPADDGNACTSEVCTNGVASHPPVAAGTPCGSNLVCNATATCVAVPTVVSVSPADGTTAGASTPIVITFSVAMNPATLTAQTTEGSCSGTVQVSADNFVTCIGIAGGAPTMVSTTVASYVPAPGLLVNNTYKVRVLVAAQSSQGANLATTFVQPNGFSTTVPYNCSATGAVVISQVFGGGGNTNAPYTNDFIELHNRGNTAVSLAGWSVQYGSSGGTTWTPTSLSGSIPAGGYYLVKESSGGSVGSPLPTADATGTISMSATAGKVALVSSTTALSGACPTGATIVDMVGFGAANCSEAAPTPTLSNTTAALRNASGCVESNSNVADFTVAAPVAHNSATSAFVCSCGANNESGNTLESDYCNIQFPTTLSVLNGTPTPPVFGQIYEAGTTEAVGANPAVTAQLGYGPASKNPQYEPGWTFVNASYNVQSGNNDEYSASFTAPAAGSYKYVYRFSLDNGASWTYCDTDGAGSNNGLTFSLQSLGSMTVQ